MYVCMYVYIYVFMCVSMHVFMYVGMYVCIHVLMYVCTNLNTSRYVFRDKFYMYVCEYVYV